MSADHEADDELADSELTEDDIDRMIAASTPANLVFTTTAQPGAAAPATWSICVVASGGGHGGAGQQFRPPSDVAPA